MANHFRTNRPGFSLIFRPWMTNPKTGERIYPKNGRVSAIRVKDWNEKSRTGKTLCGFFKVAPYQLTRLV